MIGDFTSVPLRAADRWTAARMQQGRVLLDTDWNLTVDGAARETQSLARDAIGHAGVPRGSDAFLVQFIGGELMIHNGLMWVGGMAVRNPLHLAYRDQPETPPLPTTGLALVYLDAFVESVQAAEDAELLDPALDGVDTTTRTRVGWRVRTVPAGSDRCGSGTLPAPLSTGALDVTRTSAPVSPDPCAPPDDPRTRLPDGLLRIEVIDGGDDTTALFAWSYAGGGETVAATIAGSTATLVPSHSVAFTPGDLVEVSTIIRRADRRDHDSNNGLYRVTAVTPSSGGDVVILDRPVPADPGTPSGMCLRRWDGQSQGASGGVAATIGGADVGIAFTARSGTYLVGDWWGVRVRGSASNAFETLVNAPPDGVVHATAPLAVIDLGRSTVLTDCRRRFPHLTDIRGTCTVSVLPGDDLQAALDSLPDTGGKLCLAAGTYVVRAPLTITGKRRILIEGAGPATVLVGDSHEAVLMATGCDDIEVTRLRVESAAPREPSPPGNKHLLGALTFLGGSRVRVRDCQVRCPDALGRAQSGIYVATAQAGVAPEWVEVSGNTLEVGAFQNGVLIASAEVSTVIDNEITLASRRGAAPASEPVPRGVAGELARFVAQQLDGEGAQRTITLPDAQELRVAGRAQIHRLAAEWAKRTTTSRLAREPSARVAFERFTVASLTEPHEVAVGAASARFLTDSVRDARAIGQGIVVGGSRASLVRIEGNTVVDAIQGIHVGLRQRGQSRLSADRVIISGNVVRCRVPYFWMRQRHAVYVGNVNHLTIVDNRAELVRTGGSTDATSMDAVRVWGQLGPYLQVRGLDLTGGFRFGVMLRDTSPRQSRPRSVRHISDVLNLEGTEAVSALPQSVTTERCVP